MAPHMRLRSCDGWPLLIRHATLRRLLHAQVEGLQEQRRALREALPWEALAVADEEERACQEQEVGLDIALLEMRFCQVREIEAALSRLESGEYGLCIDCGGAILHSRLRACPFAVRCCVCQEAQEAEGERARVESAAGPEHGRLGGRRVGRRRGQPQRRRRGLTAFEVPAAAGCRPWRFP